MGGVCQMLRYRCKSLEIFYMDIYILTFFQVFFEPTKKDFFESHNFTLIFEISVCINWHRSKLTEWNYGYYVWMKPMTKVCLIISHTGSDLYHMYAKCLNIGARALKFFIWTLTYILTIFRKIFESKIIFLRTSYSTGVFVPVRMSRLWRH